MPRPKPKKSTPLSTYEELRNLRLAVQIRAEQVKLRRLEWDTQRIALPHITPLAGDSELQHRTPMTRDNLPKPSAPLKPPKFEPGLSRDLYKSLVQVYVDKKQALWNRDPYNHLSSISAQKRKDDALDRRRR